MSRTAEILEKALAELAAEPEPPSSLEMLLAESIKLAKLTKVAQRISKAEFVELFREMQGRYEKLHQEFTFFSLLELWDMYGPSDFEDNVRGREQALKAYKQLQINIAQLEIPGAA